MRQQPIHLSSGNLLADRRYQWARELEGKGDLAGAADLLTQSLELAPGYASAWFALGEVRDKLGQRDAAIAAFEKACEADPPDRHGACLHLIRLGAAASKAMPECYVRALFDGYAPAFDLALTEGLAYRAPELLLRAVEAARPAMKFGTALDLGCGTGLAGAAFRPFADWLVGVDLSPEMLARARGKGLYDRLVEDDVLRFLTEEKGNAARYHLVIAADVFVYINDLAPVMRLATPVFDGLIAFSVETHAGDGVVLRDTLRYAHGAAHVRAALRSAGLKLISIDSVSTRTEKGIAVPGLTVLAGN